MKILMLNHLVSWRSRLGRANYWARYLARKGHDVTLIEISNNKHWKFDKEKKDGVTFIGSPDLYSGKARSGWDVWDVINRIFYVLPKKFDIVHSIDSRPVAILPALVSKYLRGSKLVIDWGDWWGRGGAITGRSTSKIEDMFAPIETFFEERFRRYADGSIVLSSALKDRAISLGVAPNTILQTTTGSDVEQIKQRDKKAAREALKLDQNIRIIGYVGVMYKEDQELLTEAFKLIYKSNPSVQLMLIGRKSPKNLQISSNQSTNVINIGEVNTEGLHTAIAACDAMLLPLKNNIISRGRSPAKIGDYLAAGKPVIATRVGDIASVIENTRCGALTDDNPEDFAIKTLEVLSDNDRLESMGNKSRELAERKFDWRILTDQIEKFYEKILAS